MGPAEEHRERSLNKALYMIPPVEARVGLVVAVLFTLCAKTYKQNLLCQWKRLGANG